MFKKSLFALLILSTAYLMPLHAQATSYEEETGNESSDSSSSSSSNNSTNSQEHFSVFDILNVEDSQNLGGSTPLADEIRKDAEQGGAGSVVAALILRAINLLLLTIGTFAFLTIFYAGVLMTTANGDEGKIDRAKGILTQSILGLVFSFLAYYIVTFVQSFFY